MRDIRDPQSLGEVLLQASDKYPDKPISWVYDEVLAGIAIPLYGETEAQFNARLSFSNGFNNRRSLAA